MSIILSDIQQAYYTAAQWTSWNGVLLAGQKGIESDTLKEKVGDGVTAWSSLAYSSIPAQNLSNVLGVGNTTGANDIVATNNSKYRNSDGSVNLNISNSALIDFTNTDGLYTYSLDSDATSQYIQMRSYDNATTLELAYFQAFYQQVNMGVYSAATSGRLTQLEITNGEIRTNIVNNASFEGIKYGADHSTNYTNRSLVDKGYVTGNFQPLDSDLTSWAGVTRASGFDTFVATPSSANLAALVTDETGSGALVFGTSPTFTNQINVNGLVNVVRTTEQMRLAYNGSNYFSTTVSGVGNTTFSLTGTSPTFTFSNSVNVSANDLQVGTGTMIGSLRGIEISYASNSSNLYMRNNLTSTKSMFLIGDSTYGKSVRFQYVGSAYASSGIEQADTSNLFTVGNQLNIGTLSAFSLTLWTSNTQRGSISSSGVFTFGATNQNLVFTPTATAPTLVQTGSVSSTIQTASGTRSVSLQSFASDANYVMCAGASLNFGTSDSNLINVRTNNTTRLTFSTTEITFSDTYNIVFNTTTGSKIGTASNQKIGKWGATPIVQPSGWGTPTGSVTRTTFDTTTVTLAQLAERVAGLITDLKATGEIGA